jgi:GT2 family glycosyltransferase
MKRLAAFIMTYERPKEALQMVRTLFAQNLPPAKILVVDNSLSHNTQELITNLKDARVQHLRTGYNAGPAGAANIALTTLASEGYQWIYWGDDNDPPRTTDAFERILAIADKVQDPAIGALGLMGNAFSLRAVKFRMFEKNELHGIKSVNSMAGGSMMVINSKVVGNGILPDASLFFGYEELDYCLQIKRAGYNIYIDADYYREQKEVSKKVKKDRIQRMAIHSREKTLWREYYSIRNLLVIVWGKHHSILGTVVLMSRVLFKMIFSFSKGFAFGRKYCSVALRAVVDFSRNKKGLVIQPGSI